MVFIRPCSPTCTQRPPKGRGCWVSWSKAPLWIQPCLWKWVSPEHAVNTGLRLLSTVLTTWHTMFTLTKSSCLQKNWTFNIPKWIDVVKKWTWLEMHRDSNMNNQWYKSIDPGPLTNFQSIKTLISNNYGGRTPAVPGSQVTLGYLQMCMVLLMLSITLHSFNYLLAIYFI